MYSGRYRRTGGGLIGDALEGTCGPVQSPCFRQHDRSPGAWHPACALHFAERLRLLSAEREDALRIVMELIAARVVGGKARYRRSERDCPPTGDPTLAARAEFARCFPQIALRDVVLHSTSWRYEDDHLVVTYLGYSEELVPSSLADAFPVRKVSDPGEGQHSVAAHALRHLAFLVHEDAAKFRRKIHAETIATLERVAPAVAGRHDLKGAA
jgi:hypothetical protein